jgi:hypothetical protein
MYRVTRNAGRGIPELFPSDSVDLVASLINLTIFPCRLAKPRIPIHHGQDDQLLPLGQGALRRPRAKGHNGLGWKA